MVLGWELQGSGGAGLGAEGRGVHCPHPRNAGRRLGSWAQPRAVPTVSVSCTSRRHPRRARSLSPPTWRSCSGRCFPRCPCRQHRPSKFSLYLVRTERFGAHPPRRGNPACGTPRLRPSCPSRRHTRCPSAARGTPPHGPGAGPSRSPAVPSPPPRHWHPLFCLLSLLSPLLGLDHL